MFFVNYSNAWSSDPYLEKEQLPKIQQSLEATFLNGIGPTENEITNAVAFFLSKDGYPDLAVEKDGFSHFVTTMRPKYVLPVRATVNIKLRLY